MKVGIIAAGEGSRLRGDGVTALKPLVKVNGTPILERLLRQYHSIGISEACCIINEESRAVKEYVEGLKLPLPVYFHVKSTESSMHSLFELAPYLMANHFLLSTVDSIFDTSELAGFIAAARSGRVDGLLAVTQHAGDESPLWVELDRSERIVAFRKPMSGEQLVTGGLYFFSPRIFGEKSEALRRNISRLRNFLGLLLERDYFLQAYRFTRMVDLDHAEDIRVAEEFLHSRDTHKASV